MNESVWLIVNATANAITAAAIIALFVALLRVIRRRDAENSQLRQEIEDLAVARVDRAVSHPNSDQRREERP